jgi:hypothetical protein
MEFVSFPSIEGFHNVVKESKYYRPKLNYRGKIKIHGTNSAVAIRNGQIAAQSRTQFVTPTADNAGFAKWVENHREYFSTLSMDNHTIFGEWCGPGIMKGIKHKQIMWQSIRVNFMPANRDRNHYAKRTKRLFWTSFYLKLCQSIATLSHHAV